MPYTDEPWKHEVKEARQKVYIVWFNLHEISRKGKSTETEDWLVIASDWRSGEWEMTTFG